MARILGVYAKIQCQVCGAFGDRVKMTGSKGDECARWRHRLNLKVKRLESKGWRFVRRQRLIRATCRQCFAAAKEKVL